MALTLLNSLSIPPNTIVASDIEDDAVTTDKILDDNVTADKLANSINAEIAANSDKITNATHTGDVTGATALTIATDAVDIARLNVTDGTTGQFLKTDGNNVLGFATVSVPYNDWDVKTDAYTASSKDQLIINSASTVQITLPASPSQGDTVIIKNVGAGLVTIGRNGSNIEGAAQDGTLASTKAMQVVYVTALGWKEI